jgi:uncharacterized protein (TIGR02145 family)
MNPILIALITLSTSLWSQLPSYLNPNLNYGSVTDIDGNTYATIAIGTQVWMAENLRTSKYRNGDQVQFREGRFYNSGTYIYHSWLDINSGFYTNYNNQPTSDYNGKYYNFYAINDNRNICPNGFQVPSTNEWLELINFLGGFTPSISKLSSQNWNMSTNESGFSALPSGIMGSYGSPAPSPNIVPPPSACFSGFGSFTNYWSSSITNDSVEYFALKTSISNITKTNRFQGKSVRCIKSNINNINQHINYKEINLKTYPNIAEDFINVEYTLNEKENITISLLNIEGKPIKVFGNENQIAGFKRIFLDVTDIPSGIYMLKITGNRTNAHTKIIKQ